MEVHVSLGGRENLSASIHRQLRQAILDGRLRPREPLPPTREMARRLKVARGTVTAAYDRLWGEGFVVSRVGAGTFVSDHLPRVAHNAPDRQPTGPLRARPVWESVSLATGFAREARYDFRTGLPDATLFPYGAWRRLIARHMVPEAPGRGVYGHPAGHARLREAIARHVGISRGVQALPEDVVITNGTQQALDIIARVILEPGDVIAVEAPGYMPPDMLFRSLGLAVRGVRVDRQGLDVAALPETARLVYVTPSHQYPLGMAMSLQRRLALLSWADAHNAAIVEDDYDSEFRFGGRPIEPLQTLDRNGRVIYVGSFSKTMLPTLRLGFVVAPPALRDAVYKAKYVTDWHSALPAQGALAEFIDQGGFARHIRKLRSVYEKRHHLIRAILARDFDKQLEVVPSAAGLHLTALVLEPYAHHTPTIVRRAADLGVEVHELSQVAARAKGQ
ncbi:MAG TPA: PLP-dependent aminotransferase family protein, partial [Dehalococcoidia bacterium]|nr:PLP-dependent aminotransferase family protein [Dehalococcoidia bacterium]